MTPADTPPVPEDSPGQPVPEPTPAPETTHIPEPLPVPEPTPAPETTPIPEPLPVPEPTPAPETTPIPEPLPVPEPASAPETTPIPEPLPVPEPASAPETTPIPEPPPPTPLSVPEHTPPRPPLDLHAALAAPVFTAHDLGPYLRITTPFTLPDGDPLTLYIPRHSDPPLLLDLGETLRWLRSHLFHDPPERQQQRVVELCADLDVELRSGELRTHPQPGEPLTRALTRLAQACLRVADLPTTFRPRKPPPFADEVEAHLRARLTTHPLMIVRGDRIAGISATTWSVDFRVRTGERHLLIFLLASERRDQARKLAEHVVAACTDLSHLRKLRRTPVQFITLFDDRGAAWNDADERLVTPFATPLRWSERDTWVPTLEAPEFGNDDDDDIDLDDEPDPTDTTANNVTDDPEDVDEPGPAAEPPTTSDTLDDSDLFADTKSPQTDAPDLYTEPESPHIDDLHDLTSKPESPHPENPDEPNLFKDDPPPVTEAPDTPRPRLERFDDDRFDEDADPPYLDPEDDDPS